MNNLKEIRTIVLMQQAPDRPPEPRPQPVPMPHWMLFLLYLAWLRTMRPQPSATESVLRLLIAAVALVLVVVALVAAGAPEVVANVVQQWPLTPSLAERPGFVSLKHGLA